MSACASCKTFWFWYFYAHATKDTGRIVLPLSVRQSVCRSVSTNLTWKFNSKTYHFPLIPKLIQLQGSYLVWRYISSIHIWWHQGKGHLPRSRSYTKVILKKKKKTWPCSRVLVFHKYSLFLHVLEQFYHRIQFDVKHWNVYYWSMIMWWLFLRSIIGYNIQSFIT